MSQRPFRIGIQLPEVEYTASWREHADMARIAEDIGLDSIWLGDHLLYRYTDAPPRGPWECLSMLSALAAVTSRVEIGPLVLATAFRNPAVTAKMAETIDEISGGRFVLGLGAGWNETEFLAFGLPFDRRFARFSEAFEIIWRLLRRGEVDFSGEFHQARQCLLLPRGPRHGGVPIMIGSTGARMLRRTLPFIDAWNMWYAEYGNTVEGLRPYLARLDAIAAEVGRDPHDIERTAAVLVLAPGERQRRVATNPGGDVHGIVGTPDEIAARLASFRAAGIDHIQIVLDPITRASIEWLAPAIDAAKRLS